MKRKPKMFNEDEFDLDNSNNEDEDYEDRGGVNDWLKFRGLLSPLVLGT